MQPPQSTNPSGPSSWALLIDGSALFFGQRAFSPDRNMNYLALKEIFQQRSVGTTPPKPGYFFTAADDENPKQAKFHDLIKDLGWNVHQVPPHEASVINPLLTDHTLRLIRFDSMVAYALGRLSSSRTAVSRVIVVSDSWPLSGPVRDCAARGIAVTMSYFGSFVDTRWHKVFRDAQTSGWPIDFLDLEMLAQRLFDRPRPSKRREEDFLLDIP